LLPEAPRKRRGGSANTTTGIYISLNGRTPLGGDGNQPRTVTSKARESVRQEPREERKNEICLLLNSSGDRQLVSSYGKRFEGGAKERGVLRVKAERGGKNVMRRQAKQGALSAQGSIFNRCKRKRSRKNGDIGDPEETRYSKKKKKIPEARPILPQLCQLKVDPDQRTRKEESRTGARKGFIVTLIIKGNGIGGRRGKLGNLR